MMSGVHAPAESGRFRPLPRYAAGSGVILWLMFLAVPLPPAAVLWYCTARLGLGPGPAACWAAACAAAVASAAALAASRGMCRPVAEMLESVRKFAAAGYRMEAPLRASGWPEPAALISRLNRLLLELGAYRAFHLNQVVEERAKAQALIDAVNDGILLTDDRGRTIYSNQKARDLLGIPAADAVLPGAAGRSAFFPALERVMSSDSEHARQEAAVPQAGDFPGVKSFRVTARYFRQATFSAPGRVIVIRDVTAEKEIESARETFFHMLTHDMLGPISSIQGYAELLSKAFPAAPETPKLLHPILRSARRLHGMIDDILHTIKLEHGELELHPEPVEAGALCTSVFELHEPLAARRKIDLSVARPDGELNFSGDKALLERVLSNLVGNSLKFTPAGGRVCLRCRREAGAAVFEVEDSGPGIPRGKQAEIFEKYAQLDEHRHMGFGLGLAMCKMAVELHKGRIWVESEQGKGSRFFVSIPAA